MNKQILVSGGLAMAVWMVWVIGSVSHADEYLGNLSANPIDPNSTGNPIGAGSPVKANGINNPVGPYGSEVSNQSVNNPLATDAPRLYDSEGNYRGKLSSNTLDPESVSNPIGRYGSPVSPDSINNPVGLGSPVHPESPNNPLGKGLAIYGSDGSGDHRDTANNGSRRRTGDAATDDPFGVARQPGYGQQAPDYGYDDGYENPYGGEFDFDSWYDGGDGY